MKPNFQISIVLLLSLAGSLDGRRTQNASGGQDAMKLHYDAADQYLKAGNQTRASAEYQAFLAEALHRIANGEAQAGHFAASFQLFDQALKFSPYDNNLRLDFASASLDAENFAQAKTLAEAAVRTEPSSARARFLLGRALYNLADYKDAKTQLEAAVGANPDFATGYLLAKTYLLLHDEPSAHRLFDEMVAGLGDTALLHIYFGRAYSLMDYPDLAEQEFLKATQKDSHARDAHYYLALAYLRHDETAGYAKAIPEFRAELKNNPDDARSHYMLGYIALRQQNLAEAEAELSKATALQPQDPNTLICLAEAYIAENRAPEAEGPLRKIIAMTQDSPDAQQQVGRAHYLLGRLLMKAGRTAEAREELRMSAGANPQLAIPSGPAEEARSIRSGILAGEDDRTDSTVHPRLPSEELDRLEQFRNELSPLLGEAYNNLGSLAAIQRDFKAAAEFFEEAGLWNSDLPGLDRNLGMAAYYAGRYDKALTSLQHYLATHPNDAEARAAYEGALKNLFGQKDAIKRN